MYLKHFVDSLLEWDRCEIALLSPKWSTLPFASPCRFKDIRLPGVPRSRTLRVLYEQTRYAREIHKWRPDVFLGLNTAAPLNLRVPSAIFIKALQCYFTPAAFSVPRKLYLRNLLRVLGHSRHLLVVPTKAAGDDLCHVLSVREDRVRVVPEALYVGRDSGNGQVRPEAAAHVLGLTGGRPFILHVGATYGYKNLDRLISAFAVSKRDLKSPHVLLLVGAEEKISFRQIAVWAENAGVDDSVICAGRVPDAVVLAAYGLAAGLAMVSLYETFGHPVLEAMAYGCPVVTSNRGALAEVAGNAAELVDVTSPENIAAGLAAVLGDSMHRSELIVAGHLRSKVFTWANTMTALRTIVEELA
jgi:glycosyltransferase involved in cell wall biosynthesis